jgi:hypothetical protein
MSSSFQLQNHSECDRLMSERVSQLATVLKFQQLPIFCGSIDILDEKTFRFLDFEFLIFDTIY